MSLLFQQGDVIFRILLSWFDIRSICCIDIAVGNVGERSWWVHSLQTIDNEAFNEYEHSHSSMRWIITRGVRPRGIRLRKSYVISEKITDESFAGMGILSTANQGFLNRPMANIFRGCLERLESFH